MGKFIHVLRLPPAAPPESVRQITICYQKQDRMEERLTRSAALRTLAVLLEKGEVAEVRTRTDAVDSQWSRPQSIYGGVEIRPHSSLGWIISSICVPVSDEEAEDRLERLRLHDADVEEFSEPPRSTPGPYADTPKSRAESEQPEPTSVPTTLSPTTTQAALAATTTSSPPPTSTESPPTTVSPTTTADAPLPATTTEGLEPELPGTTLPPDE